MRLGSPNSGYCFHCLAGNPDNLDIGNGTELAEKSLTNCRGILNKIDGHQVAWGGVAEVLRNQFKTSSGCAKIGGIIKTASECSPPPSGDSYRWPRLLPL